MGDPAPASLGRLLLGLPAYFLAVFLMYWSLPLGNLFLFLKCWKLFGPRNDVYQWCHFLVNILCIRFRKFGSEECYRGGPCMYLSNHRTWADFFIDGYLTEGRGQLMSRLLVLYVFPTFMIPVSLVRGCICFKRGSIADKPAFNAWIDACVAASPVPGICLFPEGSRSRLPRSLSLKRGMLHYAFSRKMPVQVVMSAHKEAVLDEKRSHVRFGATVVTGYGRVLHSSAYENFEDFFSALQASWDELWLQVFSADPAELPPLDLGNPEGFAYPWVLRLSQAVWTLLEMALMSALLAWGWAAWTSAVARLAAAASVAGVAVQVLQALPLVWLVASVLSCWDGSLPQPMLNPDGSLAPHLVASQQQTRAGEDTDKKAA